MKGDGAGQEEHSFLTTNASSRLGNIRRGAAPLAPWGRQRGPCSLADAVPRSRRLIPDHHHRRRGTRCPERGSLSPRCSGWKWPRAPGAGGCTQRAHLSSSRRCRLGDARLRTGKRREREACCCGDVFCSSMWCSRLDAFPLSWEGGEKRGCFVLSPQTGLSRPFPTLLWGTEDWDRLRGRSPSHHLVPHPPASSQPHCLIRLSTLPQISELLSKAGFVDTWKWRIKPLLCISMLTKPSLGTSRPPQMTR